MTKEEIIGYIKSHEIDFARANAAVIVCEMVFSSYADSDKVHGVLFSPVFCYISYEKLTAFYQIIVKKVISDTAHAVYAEYQKDPSSLDRKIAEHVRLEEGIDAIWRKYVAVRGRAENADLYPLFRELIDCSVTWWYYASIGEDKGAMIHETLVPKFAKRHSLPLGEADHLFNDLSHPDEQTIFNLERECFLNICLIEADRKIDDRKKDNREIEKYLANYFWFKTDFYRAKEITRDSLLSDARAELAAKGKAGVEKELAAIRDNFRRLHGEKKELLKRVTLSDEDKKDIVFAEKTILWIDIRKRGMMKHFYYLFMMVEDAAKKAGLEYLDLAIMTTDEFGEYLQTGKRISPEEAKLRREGCFLAWVKGEPRQIFYGADADELFKVYSSFKHEGDIKGQVASKGGGGLIKGTARIVLHPTKDVFHEGDILVTSMTRVEFVPMMRRAKAIITDEGGIACHAAIVAREMHKPCIIGTKIATRVLKDGDVVEVNANEGAVKILKRL